jgi:hypothetical protein
MPMRNCIPRIPPTRKTPPAIAHVCRKSTSKSVYLLKVNVAITGKGTGFSNWISESSRRFGQTRAYSRHGTWFRRHGTWFRIRLQPTFLSSSRFRVSGLGFRISSAECGVRGVGLGAWVLGLGAWGLGLGVWGLGPLGLESGVWSLMIEVWCFLGLGFGVWGLEFEV